MRGSWKPNHGRSVRLLLVAALVALPFAAMLPQLDLVVGPDEGVYGTMARLLIDGGVPYRDLFDNKPPLQYAWFSAGFAIVGDNVEALRLTTALVMSATALCVYAAGRLLFPPVGGYVSLATFAASQLLIPGITDGLPETVMLLPETAAFVALLYGLRTGKQSWFLLTGLLFGFAVLTKPVAIWPAIAFAPGIVILARGTLVLRGDTPGREWTAVLRSLALYASGGAIALLIVVAPFIISGAFAEFFDALVTFNLELSSQLSQDERVSNFGDSLLLILRRPGLTALLTGGALGLMMTGAMLRQLRTEHVAFLVFSVAVMVGVASTGYFFVHHYVQLFPALALAIAGGVFAAPRVLPTPRRRLTFVGALVLFVALPTGLVSAVSEVRAVPDPNDDPAHATVPPERRELLSDEEFLVAWDERNVALGEYLRANTQEGDRIHVHGASTSRAPVYFYADREPAVRYFFGRGLRVRPGELTALIEELHVAPPRFIVDTFGPDFRYNVSDDLDARPEAFLVVLEEQYEFIGTMHFADVYRRLE